MAGPCMNMWDTFIYDPATVQLSDIPSCVVWVALGRGRLKVGELHSKQNKLVALSRLQQGETLYYPKPKGRLVGR